MAYLSKKKQSLNHSLGLEQSQSSSTTPNRSDLENPYCNNNMNKLNSSNNRLEQSNEITIGEKRMTHRKSESNISDTSAIIRMNQNIKKKILRNHLMLILLLNLVQIGSLLFSIIYPAWYDDSNSIPPPAENGDLPSDTEIKYGLLFNYSNGHTHTNSFQKENNKEIGGMSSFIMFTLGIVIQLIYVFQLLVFFKSYPMSIQNRGCKLLKFKTCRWLCLFLYLGAISYWIMVVFLVQIVSNASNFSQLQYGFWISVGCIASFMLICIYFNFVKKKIRKNDLVSNLLNANRYLKMDEDQENAEEF